MSARRCIGLKRPSRQRTSCFGGLPSYDFLLPPIFLSGNFWRSLCRFAGTKNTVQPFLFQVLNQGGVASCPWTAESVGHSNLLTWMTLTRPVFKPVRWLLPPWRAQHLPAWSGRQAKDTEARHHTSAIPRNPARDSHFECPFSRRRGLLTLAKRFVAHIRVSWST